MGWGSQVIRESTIAKDMQEFWPNMNTARAGLHLSAAKGLWRAGASMPIHGADVTEFPLNNDPTLLWQRRGLWGQWQCQAVPGSATMQPPILCAKQSDQTCRWSPFWKRGIPNDSVTHSEIISFEFHHQAWNILRQRRGEGQGWRIIRRVNYSPRGSVKHMDANQA